MKQAEDLTGRIFGNWLVCGRGEDKIYRTARKEVTCIMWKVICPHTQKQVTGASLRGKHSTGCPKCWGERQSKERQGKLFRRTGTTEVTAAKPSALGKKQTQFEAQGGICGLCNTALLKDFRKSHWDHNHETGKLRAIVHPRCNNWVIALVECHLDLVEKAKAYLQKWK